MRLRLRCLSCRPLQEPDSPHSVSHHHSESLKLLYIGATRTCASLIAQTLGGSAEPLRIQSEAVVRRRHRVGQLLIECLSVTSSRAVIR